MLKSFFTLITCLFCCVLLFSQNKLLTIDDAVIDIWRKLAPENIKGLDLRPTKQEFSKIDNNNLSISNFDKSKTQILLTSDELNNMLNLKKHEPVKNFPPYEWLSENTIRITTTYCIADIDIINKKIINYLAIQTDFDNIDFCPNNYTAAYTIDNNLYIINSGGEKVNISNDTNKNIVYGQTVHRNEFGISKGSFWSPSGNYLAFYRKDESMVTNYPLVNTNKRIAEVNNIKYCMAGMKSEEVSLGIYNVHTKNITYIQTGEPKEQYLTNIAWHTNEKSIYIAVLNREQNHLKLNEYDISNGKLIKTLFEEQNSKYVEPQNPILFLPNDNTKFIWQSRRDGYNHIYLYDTNGKLVKQLTQGKYEIDEVYNFSPDGKYLFFKANKESPIDFDIYSLNLTTNKQIKLSENSGLHRAIFSKDYKYYIDNYSSTSTPNTYTIHNIKGDKINTILISKNPLSEYKLGDMIINKITADDNTTDLYYRMILPPNFDSTKQYPVIVYVYGGPHNQLIRNKWLGGASGWDYYMAQEGYIMFTLDNRGTSNRGAEFENIIHRQLGNIEVKDQMKGIEYLKKLKFVDTNRIGVHGWSYGGFMTITMLTEHSDIFKVGVAGGPVINWELYEIMYGERYMDTPQENKEGYDNANLLNKVDKLKGRLMIIHGAQDPVVVWQHSLNFVQKCIENKILVDYFIYPTHEHNVRGLDRIHLMRTITRYFKENL